MISRVFAVVRPVVCLTVVAAALAVLPSIATAQVTVENLIGSAVSDATGPQYSDIADAITRFKNSDVAGAKELLEAAKKKNPKLPPAEVLLAQLLAAANQGGAARAELERAVLAYPNDPDAYLIFADVAFQDRRVTDAEALFQKAKTLADAYNENPKRKRNFSIRVLAGLAAVAEARQQWETASNLLGEWLKIDPDSVVAHQRLGRALFQQNKAKEAYAEYQAAVKLDPKAANPDVIMARLYEEAKDRANAKKFIDFAVQKYATDLKVQLAAAEWALVTNQLNDAQKYAEAALKLDSKSMEAKIIRGHIARLTGDFKTAEAQLEAAHLQSPGNVNAANQLALVLAEQDDSAKKQRALELAELNVRATTQGQNFNPEAVATLGWVFYKLGRTADAEKALQAVLNTQNLSPDSAYYVSKVLQDRGRGEDAAKLLEAALKSPTPFAQRQNAADLLAQINKKPKEATPKEK